MSYKPLIYFCISAFALSGCDPRLLEDENTESSAKGPRDSYKVIETAPACYAEHFKQPEAKRTDKLDLLFVLDTASTLQPDRVRIANKIDRFLRRLPQDVHYRIAVLLAHGPKSPLHGKLYFESLIPGNAQKYLPMPLVFDSKLHHRNWIRLNLALRLKLTPPDLWANGGEAAFSSLYRFLEEDRIREHQELGFMREDAALGVVFVSDRKELCAEYPEGITPTVSKIFYKGVSVRRIAKEEYCTVTKADGSTLKLTPQSIYERLNEVKSESSFTVGAIVHTEYGYRKGGRSLQEYGYGYMDLVELANGVAIDISEKDYRPGLESLADRTLQNMELYTKFRLSQTPVDPETIDVWVDNRHSDYRFVEKTSTVHLDDAGRASSKIEVEYCVVSDDDSGDDNNGGGDNGNGGGDNGGGDNGGGGDDGNGGGDNGGGDDNGGGGDPGINGGGSDNDYDDASGCTANDCIDIGI